MLPDMDAPAEEAATAAAAASFCFSLGSNGLSTGREPNDGCEERGICTGALGSEVAIGTYWGLIEGVSNVTSPGSGDDEL